MEVLKQKLKTISGGRILDVGTGTGKFIPIITEGFKDYTQIIGIDNDERALQTAQEQYGQENIQFIKMDAENITFPNESFDTVCISNTLHHLGNVNRTLQETKRVMKSHGYFLLNEIICDTHKQAQLTHIFYHHLVSDIDTLIGIRHNKTFKRQEIINSVRNTGIEITDMIEYVENKDTVKNMDELDTVALALDNQIEKLKGLPEYETFKQRGEHFKRRLYDTGILRATQLIIMGRK
ncbi:class I SAM-dependent methyltransferase [candidate division WOR-3 bacterium]|nr:class I SAM-dependent methyltransferase [candidate division WOR-3 bacterium]